MTDPTPTTVPAPERDLAPDLMETLRRIDGRGAIEAGLRAAQRYIIGLSPRCEVLAVRVSADGSAAEVEVGRDTFLALHRGRHVQLRAGRWECRHETTSGPVRVVAVL